MNNYEYNNVGDFMKKVFIILCLVLLFSCNNKFASQKRQITIADADFVSTLDPAYKDIGVFLLRYGIGETLFKLDENLNPQPFLAESYERIDDLTWQISLKDNIKFSDGTLLDLQMVVKNLKRIAQLNKKAFFLLDSTYEIEDKVLTIKTSSPHPTLINDLCEGYAIILNLKANYSHLLKPITTGPFQVVNFNEKNELNLKANKYYWQEKAKIANLTIVKADNKNLLNNLENGYLSAYVGFLDLPFKSKTLISENGPTYLNVLFYNLNLSSNLRQVISLIIQAVKKEDMTKNIINYPYFRRDNFKTAEEYLMQAKELLSGYSDNDKDGYLEENNHKLKVNIILEETEAIKDYVYKIQKTLIDLGIACDIKESKQETMLAKSKYDIYFFKALPFSNGTYNSFLNALLSEDGAYNFNEYTSYITNSLIRNLNQKEITQANELVKEIASEIENANNIVPFSEIQLKLIKQNKWLNFGLGANGYYLLNNLSIYE